MVMDHSIHNCGGRVGSIAVVIADAAKHHRFLGWNWPFLWITGLVIIYRIRTSGDRVVGRVSGKCKKKFIQAVLRIQIRFRIQSDPNHFGQIRIQSIGWIRPEKAIKQDSKLN